MSILPIRIFGDPVLTSRAEEITEVDAAIRTLVSDMFDTMDESGGVGLAANQVGVLRRIFVYDCEGDRGHIINPVWEPVGEEQQVGPEGCLSIPDIQAETARYEKVRVQGTTVDGEEIDREVTGLLSRCVQHETDHLDGILFLKRLDKEEKKKAMQQIRMSEWFRNP